jgi:hypothetical protein
MKTKRTEITAFRGKEMNASIGGPNDNEDEEDDWE